MEAILEVKVITINLDELDEFLSNGCIFLYLA